MSILVQSELAKLAITYWVTATGDFSILTVFVGMYVYVTKQR